MSRNSEKILHKTQEPSIVTIPRSTDRDLKSDEIIKIAQNAFVIRAKEGILATSIYVALIHPKKQVVYAAYLAEITYTLKKKILTIENTKAVLITPISFLTIVAQRELTLSYITIFENTFNSLNKEEKDKPLLQDYKKKCEDAKKQQQNIFLASIVSNDPIAFKNYLENKMDVNFKGSEFAATPLHLAANYNRPEFVKKLLEAKADLNAQTIFKSTPLHYAAAKINTSIIKMLITAGANKDIVDISDLKPLDLLALQLKKTTTELKKSESKKEHKQINPESLNICKKDSTGDKIDLHYLVKQNYRLTQNDLERFKKYFLDNLELSSKVFKKDFKSLIFSKDSHKLLAYLKETDLLYPFFYTSYLPEQQDKVKLTLKKCLPLLVEKNSCITKVFTQLGDQAATKIQILWLSTLVFCTLHLDNSSPTNPENISIAVKSTLTKKLALLLGATSVNKSTQDVIVEEVQALHEKIYPEESKPLMINSDETVLSELKEEPKVSDKQLASSIKSIKEKSQVQLTDAASITTRSPSLPETAAPITLKSLLSVEEKESKVAFYDFFKDLVLSKKIGAHLTDDVVFSAKTLPKDITAFNKVQLYMPLLRLAFENNNVVHVFNNLITLNIFDQLFSPSMNFYKDYYVMHELNKTFLALNQCMNYRYLVVAAVLSAFEIPQSYFLNPHDSDSCKHYTQKAEQTFLLNSDELKHFWGELIFFNHLVFHIRANYKYLMAQFHSNYVPLTLFDHQTIYVTREEHNKLKDEFVKAHPLLFREWLKRSYVQTANGKNTQLPTFKP